jgi:4,5-dihydroxyphthalate decarboxylase
MSLGKLSLSIACGDYDRTRPLLDGRVLIDGVSPTYMTLSPEELFFRAMRQQAFDVSELSLSSYLIKHSRGECPYIAVPIFLSRAFRHTSMWVRKDRIKRPEDLKGKRIGLPEYQLTAHVWARAILQADHGVSASDVTWVRGGIESAGRLEKIPVQLPANIRIEDSPEHTLSELLDRGEIDGFMAPRPPSAQARQNPTIAWLFDDPTAAAKDYYRRSGIFPIMHVLAVRKSLAEAHPWLPVALYKAFNEAKQLATDHLADTSAPKVMLPFVEEQLAQARSLMGADFWSYGVADNLPTLNAFCEHHHTQGLSPRRVAVSELFHPSCYESFKI